MRSSKTALIFLFLVLANCRTPASDSINMLTSFHLFLLHFAPMTSLCRRAKWSTSTANSKVRCAAMGLLLLPSSLSCISSKRKPVVPPPKDGYLRWDGGSDKFSVGTWINRVNESSDLIQTMAVICLQFWFQVLVCDITNGMFTNIPTSGREISHRKLNIGWCEATGKLAWLSEKSLISPWVLRKHPSTIGGFSSVIKCGSDHLSRS